MIGPEAISRQFLENISKDRLPRIILTSVMGRYLDVSYSAGPSILGKNHRA